MFLQPSNIKIYLTPGITDMRKSINTLSILVQEHMELDPFSGHFFVFSNRRKNIIKILYWDRNGFCLWQKRLEKDIFRWPDSASEVLEIDNRQLGWLIEGLEVQQGFAHDRLMYSTMF